MATIDERRGTIFAGRYRLERKLGSGGMADVWLAEDQELGRKVAIKMLHERYANDVQFVERFRREATHAAGLSHPNVVSIYDRGEAEGSYFIVMEYVEGRTLKELIVTRGPCPVPVAISYTRQVLAALRYAHRNGIVHRDIKPHNVLVDHEGRVKVADFGIARAGSSQMTEAGSIIGTAQYLSPGAGAGCAGRRVVRSVLDGHRPLRAAHREVPFTGETPVEIAMKHLSQVPEAPSTIRPRDPARPRPDRPPRAREGAGRPVPDREGDGSRPRARRPRRARRAGDRGGRDDGAPRRDDRGDGRGAARPPAGYGGDERYRSYEGEVRRGRAWWPWLLALGAAIAIGIGAWLFYDNVQDELDANEPVIVDNYEGILEENAVDLIRGDGFEPKVIRLPNGEVEPKYVFEQEPAPGTGLPKGSIVTILVSTGKQKIAVPSVVGQVARYGGGRADERRPRRRRASRCRPTSRRASSRRRTRGPAPCSSRARRCGSTSRRARSRSPCRTSSARATRSPPRSCSSRASRSAGSTSRATARPARSSTRRRPGNSTASRGSPVTLSVSRGPKTVTVPDVSLQTVADARTTLRAAGFKVSVVRQETDDESLDGLVMSQDPAGRDAGRPRLGRDVHRRRRSCRRPT